MAQTEAVEFLRAALAGGERPATEVLREAAALGIAEITLRRARKALGVQVRRQGFGRDGRRSCADYSFPRSLICRSSLSIASASQ